MYARSIQERIEELASYSEEVGRLTRPFASSAMRKANDAVGRWMRAAGMSVHQDSIGNLIGRYEASRSSAKTLMLGSHLDTVRDAGKYDGVLGVLIALACMEYLHDQAMRLPFAIEIVAFADEEGLRYSYAYLGSKVLTGVFDPQYLDRKDADGITMAKAILAFGGNPALLTADKRPSDDLLGYCEVHIEQGPVLEELGLPVGLVSTINGQSRINLDFVGKAGHAGTVPMHLRQDALSAAAEFVLAAEELAQRELGLVATSGQIVVQPGASNVIPGKVSLSLDVRHANDAVRQQACHLLQECAEQICNARRISLSWQLLQTSSSVSCSPALTEVLAEAILAAGYPVHRLPSGA